MAESLRCVPPEAVIVGWDFSTGGVKALAFDLHGNTLAEIRLPTDLWTEGGVSELSLLQLEGQARASTRMLASRLRAMNRLQDWLAGGISATHHSASRIDADHAPIRRLICWNDQTLPAYHAKGLARLGGPERVHELIGGPWASRYSLSHLVKDEETLSRADWERTRRILPHGALAAGYLTGNFDVVSVSSAASSGIMDLRSRQWRREMLDALEQPAHRDLAWQQLPQIIDAATPVGPLSLSLAQEAGLDPAHRPMIFPTSDDQQAGLVGGGAVDAGQLAIILGNSAVVNGSSAAAPTSGTLDVMRLNWGPYLWMRCYNNGAQFLDRVIGSHPDWPALERAARAVPAGCNGTTVLPFIWPEPSRGVMAPRVAWMPREPSDRGVRYRAALEALAYLIAVGVREHEAAGAKVNRVTISGGIAKSDLMGEILATVLDRPLERLVSHEGPALGAAVTALAALETYRRCQAGIPQSYSVADAVKVMVRYRDPVSPVAGDREAYQQGLERFVAAIA